MAKRLLFADFLNSEKLAGILLMFCSVFSIILANTNVGDSYTHFWHQVILGKSLEFWINDGLMTIFFLLVGLEIEREFYIGELSNIRKSMLPMIAALGGMLIPALIYLGFNAGTPFQSGFGIPMATDIAFSLAVLALLGKRVPLSLKIFLTALAIIDDLGAILVIAIFYSQQLSLLYLGIAFGLWLFMFLLNRLKVYRQFIYLVLGMLMWYFMYKSGVHASITGVLLAIAIPFGSGDDESPSHILQHRLHLVVALFIVPLFALANTAIPLQALELPQLISSNSLGIMLGLLLGKPLGIYFFSIAAVALGICKLPAGVRKWSLFWVACLGGIGFTMSIFITMLAFTDPAVTNLSKVAIIIGSVLSGMIGYLGLKYTLDPKETKAPGISDE